MQVPADPASDHLRFLFVLPAAKADQAARIQADAIKCNGWFASQSAAVFCVVVPAGHAFDTQQAGQLGQQCSDLPSASSPLS